MAKHLLNDKGFTLIELMIVMAIVALLMGMVGPLAINSLEKAEAKQEMLSLKNWLKKISARAFYTGKIHRVELKGKQVTLFISNEEEPLTVNKFESLSFQPQNIMYNRKGFVNTNKVTGTYRGKPLELSLHQWVNKEQPTIK